MMTRLALLLSLLLSSSVAQALFPSGFTTSPNVCSSYMGLIKSMGFTSYWRLSESSGATAADSIGSNTGTYQNSATFGVRGALITPSQGVTLNGSTQYISTSTSYNNPLVFTVMAWFKTTTTSGGKILGFGSSQTGMSGNYDRHIYMTNSGQLIFGTWTGSIQAITSTSAYNDGAWHMLVATMGAGGMTLNVDADPQQTLANSSAQSYSGYWRVGYDSVGGWPSQPSSNYFAGSIADVAIATGTALNSSQISLLYSIGAQCSGVYVPPAPALSITTAAQSVVTNACSAVTTVKSNLVAGSNITVNLSGPAGVTFYSNSNCTSSTSTVTISTGQQTANFYFLANSTGSKTIQATATSYSAASQAESIITDPYIWTGSGADANWTTGANWSGGAAPGNSNTAIFDASCTLNCSPTINASLNIKGISMTGGYSGTITQGAATTITIGSSGWTMGGGTFLGSSATITLNGPFSLSGGSFRATSGNIQNNNQNWSVIGVPTFDANGGTVTFGTGCCATMNVTPGFVTYKNVTVNLSSGTTDFGGNTMTIAGTLSLNSGWVNNGTLNVGGDVSVNGGYAGSSAVVVLTGNASGQSVTVSSGTLPGLQISAGSNPVTLNGTVAVDKSFTFVSASPFNVAGSTLAIGGGICCVGISVVPGTATYNNVTIQAPSGSVDLGGGTMTVAGSLVLGVGDIKNGTFNVTGDITANGTYYYSSAVVVAAGNPSGQTITNPSGQFPTLRIAAGANPVTLSGTVTVNNIDFVSAGTFNVAGSTLIVGPGCCNTYTANFGSGTFNNVQLGGGSATINITSSMLASGNVTIPSTLTIHMPNPGAAYQFTVTGALTNAGTLNLHGATLSNGSLTNTGTINP